MKALSIVFAVAAFLLAASPQARAEKKCFTIVNRTLDTVKAFSKDGDRVYCEAEPLSVKKCCCDTMFERLCFNKSGETSKLKIVRIEPEHGVEYSGQGCRKIYASPDMRFDVTYEPDGVHTSCRLLAPDEDIKPLPDFERADVNKDGVVDEEEANRIKLKVNPEQYGTSITRDEYNRILGIRF